MRSVTGHVTDMRKVAASVNASLFYARPNALERHSLNGTIIRRPLEWFLTDLVQIAKETHPDLMLCWIRDALIASSEAAEIHMFASQSSWRGLPTPVRVHLIGEHGYKYLSLGFVQEPDPHWCVIGARDIQVWKYDGTVKIDDDSYARDATRAW